MNELLKSFSKLIGLVNHNVTTQEFLEISRLISTIPPKDRVIGDWQGAASKVVKNALFVLNEGLDLSNINAIQLRIISLLNSPQEKK